METEIQYPLQHPFTYSHKGEQHEASIITLSAPTSKHSRECAALKQAFFRAVPKQEPTGDTDKESPPPKGSDVIVILAMSTVVDLPDVLEVARKLFLNGVAMVDGEAKLTNHLVDQMHQDDFEAMTGEYLVGFTLASVLGKTSAS